MDLHKFTTAQLYIMHRTATDDARRALALAEHKSIELLELAATCDHELYNVHNAEFAVLMAQADDHRAYSRQIYDEIVRRAQVPHLTHVPMVCTACREPASEAPGRPGVWWHDGITGCTASPVKVMVAAGNENVPARSKLESIVRGEICGDDRDA